MCKIYKYLQLLLLLLSFVQLFAQDAKIKYSEKIDSLQARIDDQSTQDTIRVIAMDYMASLCLYDNQFKRSLATTILSRELAHRIKFKFSEGMHLAAINRFHPFFSDAYGIMAHWELKGKYNLHPNMDVSSYRKIDTVKMRLELTSMAEKLEKTESSEMAAHAYYFMASYSNDLNAISYLQRAESILSNLNLVPALTECKLRLAIFYKNTGRVNDARLKLNEAITLIENQTNTKEKALLYYIVSVYYMRQGETETAINILEYLLKSSEILESLNERYLLSTVYFRLGYYLHFLDIQNKSVEYLKKFYDLTTEASNEIDVDSWRYLFYVWRLNDAGHTEEAERMLSMVKSKKDINRDGFLDAEGQILMTKGHYKEALAKFYEINALSSPQYDVPSGSCFNNYYIAKCLSELGDIQKSNLFALSSYQQCVEGGLRFIIGKKSSYLLYKNYEKTGQLNEALRYLKSYTEILSDIEKFNVANKTSGFEIQVLINKSERNKQLEEQRRLEQEKENQNQRWWLFSIAAGLFSSFIVIFLLIRNNRDKQRANQLLEKQKEEIDNQKNKIEQALTELKSTQVQLIQSEKMASLGELTAGIAHEIQNPLNFVNNFSEVNQELIRDLKSEVQKGNFEEVNALANDIESNEEKISHHGKRADGIVKSMLQHSRTSSGKKELTDINALCDEYLRLAYHGLRAKDKSFNAKFETYLDPTLPKLNVIPQDIGRVLLNLINNAFYAVTLRHSKGDDSYQPTVWVSTKNLGDKIEISVKDNGNGIPDSIKEKIFQPFFTTKPTGQGTGLGLSLSYDIVKAHGGEFKVVTKENEGSEFIISLSTN